MRAHLHATAEARDTARFLLTPPVPRATLPVYAVVAAGAITLLPRFVRRELRLPPVLPLAEPLMVRPAATALLGVLDWALAPEPASHGNAESAVGAVEGDQVGRLVDAALEALVVPSFTRVGYRRGAASFDWSEAAEPAA